ncbi:DinI-like family protein [Pasteurella oralis]|uniref:DinI-like family protein n=1 Tax=Pasteurella oralis TaxID=1071947 RepID=A0ABW4NVR7_9PAST
MKKLDIRFKKETNKKLEQQQLEMISKLSERLPNRIAEKFNNVFVSIRLSSSTGYEITGFSSDDKKKFLEYLEELWNDDTLIE